MVIALVLVALVVIALFIVVTRRRAATSKDVRRAQAEEHRNLAQVAQLEAERARGQAADLSAKADRLDPDKGRRR